MKATGLEHSYKNSGLSVCQAFVVLLGIKMKALYGRFWLKVKNTENTSLKQDTST